MNHVDKKQGFTLIELMLAMGFVSALLIAVAMTVIQIANIYNRGITLKDVNQVGRSLVSELQRGVTSTSSFDLATHYIKQSQGGVEVGGRLCLGQYSYAWNYGETITPGDTSSSPNVYAAPDNDNQIRFVKVHDPDISYCTVPAKKIIFADAVEMLNVGEHDLAIHDFVISSAATASDTKTGQQLYSISFILGTNDQTALSGVLSSTECRPPSDKNSDLAYCSINRFDIVVRTGKKEE